MKLKKKNRAQESASVNDETIADSPNADAPIADSPIVDSPIVDSPIVDVPNVDAPIVDVPNNDNLEQTLNARVKQKRKPRSDAGKKRKPAAASSGVEEETGGELSSEEVAQVAQAFGDLLANTASALSSYAAMRYDPKWQMTPPETGNFAIAFRMIARKHAHVISDSPESYFLGVAILGYLAPRVLAAPEDTANVNNYVSERLTN